jgi:hypothetical protein
MSDVENRINSGKISENAKYYLSLITADIREIPQEYILYAYPLSSSWTNGTGKFVNLPYTTDGVSWRYRTSKTVGTEWDIPPGVASLEWDEISQTWVDAAILFGTNYISATVTSSYFTHEGGGTWWDYDNLECTQSFSFQSSDIYMDVTNIARKWVTGSGRFENDGMILKFSNEIESSPDNLLNSLKFFGTDSNTIYVPRLNIVWDDSEFITGSLESVAEDNINLNVKLKKFMRKKKEQKLEYMQILVIRKKITQQLHIKL